MSKQTYSQQEMSQLLRDNTEHHRKIIDADIEKIEDLQTRLAEATFSLASEKNQHSAALVNLRSVQTRLTDEQYVGRQIVERNSYLEKELEKAEKNHGPIFNNCTVYNYYDEYKEAT